MYYVRILIAVICAGMLVGLMVPEKVQGGELTPNSYGLTAKLGWCRAEYNPVNLEKGESFTIYQFAYQLGAEYILSEDVLIPKKLGNAAVGVAFSGREAERMSAYGLEGHFKAYLKPQYEMIPYLDAFIIYAWTKEKFKAGDTLGGTSTYIGQTYDKERIYYGGGIGCMRFINDNCAVDLHARMLTNVFKFNRNSDYWTNNWSGEIYLGGSYWFE